MCCDNTVYEIKRGSKEKARVLHDLAECIMTRERGLLEDVAEPGDTYLGRLI